MTPFTLQLRQRAQTASRTTAHSEQLIGGETEWEGEGKEAPRGGRGASGREKSFALLALAHAILSTVAVCPFGCDDDELYIHKDSHILNIISHIFNLT